MVEQIDISDCFIAEIDIASLLLNQGMVSSKGEFDRLAKQNAIDLVDGDTTERVTKRRWDVPLNCDFIIKVGKLRRKKFYINEPRLKNVIAETMDIEA